LLPLYQLPLQEVFLVLQLIPGMAHPVDGLKQHIMGHFIAAARPELGSHDGLCPLLLSQFIGLWIVHDFLNGSLYKFTSWFIKMMVSGPLVPVFQAPADAFIDEPFKGFKVFEIVQAKFALIPYLVTDLLIDKMPSINFEILLSD